MPILLPGGLFSIGDGHSVQGDGDVNVTAIETSMNGTIQVGLHRNLPLTALLGETPTHFAMGFGETLDRALAEVLERAIALLVARSSWDVTQVDFAPTIDLSKIIHIILILTHNYQHK